MEKRRIDEGIEMEKNECAETQNPTFMEKLRNLVENLNPK